jgi:hypothetical protein
MADRSAGGTGRRLRAVDDRPAPGAALLGEAAEECIRAARGGIAPRALGVAVAERLGLPADRIPPDALQVALGLLIAGDRVDEVGGRLVAVAQERRRAG